jgi:hypothetical protein
MILDETAEFSNSQSLAFGAIGTVLIGNVLGLGSNGVRLGQGTPFLVIRVTALGVGGAGATAQFILASDAQSAIATDGTATHHYATGPVPFEVMAPGYMITAYQLPAGPYERYLGILQKTAVAGFTSGKVDMYLTLAPTSDMRPATLS